MEEEGTQRRDGADIQRNFENFSVFSKRQEK
jgi:hypothetical protein